MKEKLSQEKYLIQKFAGFFCNIRSNQINVENCHLLSELGCLKTHIGIESGDNLVLSEFR